MNQLDLKNARRSLSEQAYQAIRDSIISLQLAPGQLVSELEIASRLGVSRTPVREAFRMLLLEELIEVLPQRGVRIALISKRKVEETRFVRESLEVNAFKKVARLWQADAEKFMRMKEKVRLLFHEQDMALKQQDPFKFLQLDEDFHGMIIELTDNQTLLTVITNMRGHLNRVRYLTLKELDQMGNLVSEHEALFQAIVSNHEEAIAELLEHHLQKLPVQLPQMMAKYPHYFTE